jgi:hypothetical protein
MEIPVKIYFIVDGDSWDKLTDPLIQQGDWQESARSSGKTSYAVVEPSSREFSTSGSQVSILEMSVILC